MHIFHSRMVHQTSATIHDSPERINLLYYCTSVKRQDGTKESKENSRQHQLAPGACDEVWQRSATLTDSTATTITDSRSHSRLQVDSQDTPIGQSQACYHCRQHTSSTKVRAGILLYAVQDKCSPLCRKQRKSTPQEKSLRRSSSRKALEG